MENQFDVQYQERTQTYSDMKILDMLPSLIDENELTYEQFVCLQDFRIKYRYWIELGQKKLNLEKIIKVQIEMNVPASDTAKLQTQLNGIKLEVEKLYYELYEQSKHNAVLKSLAQKGWIIFNERQYEQERTQLEEWRKQRYGARPTDAIASASNTPPLSTADIQLPEAESSASVSNISPQRTNIDASQVPQNTSSSHAEARTKHQIIGIILSIVTFVLIFPILTLTVFTKQVTEYETSYYSHTIPTYICYVTQSGECYHQRTCGYIKYSYLTQTTIYEAEAEGYRKCSNCDDFEKTSLTIKKEYKRPVDKMKTNYVAPILIGLVSSTIIYFLYTMIMRYTQTSFTASKQSLKTENSSATTNLLSQQTSILKEKKARNRKRFNIMFPTFLVGLLVSILATIFAELFTDLSFEFAFGALFVYTPIAFLIVGYGFRKKFGGLGESAFVASLACSPMIILMILSLILNVALVGNLFAVLISILISILIFEYKLTSTKK